MRARFLARLAAPGAVLLVSAGLATAQQAHWTSIGPRGGEISQIVFDPADPTLVYATSERSGVFKSRNGGRFWQPANADLPVDERVVHAIAVAGSELLIGTDSDGAWRSVDAGAHWTSAGFAQLDVVAVGLDPGSSGLAFASIDFDIDHNNGVWSSRDGGSSWQRADGGIEGLVAGNFVVHPGTQSPAVVYAGLVGFNEQLAGRCVVKSVDGGAHWSVLGSGLPVPASPSDAQQCFIALDPAAPATLYLAMRIFAGAPEVLTTATFKSVDGGEHWQQMAGPGGFPIATGAAGSVWTPLGRSGDGGATWRTFPQPIPTVEPIDDMVSPGGLAPIPGVADQALMSDLPDGVVRVVGGGDAVLLSNRGLIAVDAAEFAVRATQPTSFLARTEFSLVQHAGPGTLWQTTGPPLGDNYAYLQPLVHPADPDLLYAQAFAPSPDDGVVISNDGGEHWRTVRGPGSRIWQLTPSPLSTRVLYAAVGGLKAGDCGLFVSTNLARHWSCLGLPAPMRGVVVDRKAESTLYGLPAPHLEVPNESVRPLQKSVDAGRTWHASQVGAGGWPMALAIASSRSHRIYLATSAGMFRSDDDGASWQPAGNGLPPALFDVLELVSVIVDPGRPEVAYVAGSEQGVFRTGDAGANWTMLDPTMPAALFAPQIALDPSDPHLIYAGTFEQGMLVLPVP
jgi:photosystem II stability/assembly factor-like uncharacterized protein